MAPVLEIQELRNFLRDKAELNSLIGKEESDDTVLVDAISDAIDDYNTTPPLTKFNDESFPSKSLLKIGATLWVLRSAGMEMSRNHLTYQDGGISVEVNEKTQLYQSWIQSFERLWEQRKRAVKVEQNLRAGWGGVSSSYNGVSGWW